MPEGKNVVFDWLTSLKLTLVLFLVLAAASVIGTILPQGASLAELKGHLGPTMGFLINALALNNVFHSTWYRILLLLLCTNLVACTIDRIPKTIRLLRKSETPFDSQRLSKFSLNKSFAAALPLERAQRIVESTVGETFGRVRPVASGGPYCAVSETGRWSRFMVHVVHLSVLIILAGALAGSCLGFKGTMNLAEGESSDMVTLAGGENIQKLPFSLRCDKFDVSFYNTGAPKEYKSDLSVIKTGREIFKKSIVVNHPLTYEGITVYQASYGTTLKSAEIELTDPDSGKKIAMTLPLQQPVSIPGTSYQLGIAEYNEDLMGFGQAVELAYGKPGQQFSARWILVDRPFHGNVIGNYKVRVTRTDKTRFTGLEVKEDPGVWLVWAGFTLLTLAIGLTFYSSHRKLWICIEPDKKGKKAIVTLAGKTSRNSHIFEEKIEELRATLEERLKNPHSSGKRRSNTDKEGNK